MTTAEQAKQIIVRKLEETAEAWYEPRSEATNGGIVADVRDCVVRFPDYLDDDAPDCYDLTIMAVCRGHEVEIDLYVTLDFPDWIVDRYDTSKAIVTVKHIREVRRAY